VLVSGGTASVATVVAGRAMSLTFTPVYELSGNGAWGLQPEA
jgi:hypothetical protein